MLRRITFWIHLLAGVVAGSIVLVMSATGVLLTYERQMVAWADGRTVQIAPHAAGARRVPVDSLIAGARTAGVRGRPSAVTVRAASDAPATVAFGRDGSVLVDPYTGTSLGQGAPGMRAFFRVVTDWHRWLGRSGDGRTTARSITGACNLAFLVLVLTGAFLWIPRPWSRKRVRNVAWFRGGLSAKARDFNWHNVIGIWSFVPLAIVVASGVVISYPWASALVYRAMGEEPPARQGPPGGGEGARPNAPAGAPTAEGPRGGRPEQVAAAASAGEGRRGARAGGGEGRGERGGPPSVEGVERALTRAEGQVPGWRTLQVTLPTGDAPRVTVSIDEGTGGQPQKRGTLTVDRATGEVVKWEPFSSQTPGRRLRSILRFAHTGEVGGLLGQTIAGLASLGGVVLVWTGIMLAFRRFRAWLARRAVVRAPEQRRAAA